MRRLDVLIVGLATLVGGGTLYVVLRWVGLELASAQLWTSSLLVLGLTLWTLGYLRRVVRGDMAISTQQQAFEKARIQEQLDKMSPEELEALQRQLAEPEPEDLAS